MPTPEVSSLLNEKFVCLAEDCDTMSPEVRAIGAQHMSSASMLPFILLIDSEGNWLGGMSGMVTKESFLQLLQKACGE